MQSNVASGIGRVRERRRGARRLLAPLMVVAVVAASVVVASPASATFTSAPTTIQISGVARVDQTLTIEVAPTDYTPAADSFTFQWYYQNGTPIPGATGQTYTPTIFDLDQALYAVVSAYRSVESMHAVETVTVGLVGLGEFVLDAAPALPSPAWVGEPVTVTAPTLTPTPGSTTYAWFYEDGPPVPGAGNGPTYTPVVEDVGQQLYVGSTSELAGYQSYVAWSNLTGAVALNSFDEPEAPSILGTGIVGTPFTVEVHLDSWDPEPESFSYQWFTASSDDPLGDAIPGETGAEFTPGRDLIGRYVYAEVTAHHTGYQSYIVGSGRSAVVFDVFSFELDASIVTPGSAVSVEATGLEPDTEYVLELHSDPVSLATVTTDSFGAFSAPVTIPTGTEARDHRIVLLLDDAEIASAAITVVAPDGDDSPAGAVPAASALPPTGTLPATGADLARWSAWLATVLMVAGVGLLTTRRGSRRFGHS